MTKAEEYTQRMRAIGQLKRRADELLYEAKELEKLADKEARIYWWSAFACWRNHDVYGFWDTPEEAIEAGENNHAGERVD